ncbi:YhjD/YihY/BrkB family envelope integrity protein [Corynebacterium sphenisci]|uniref:YhjD/YihY/BrkB family envelope integrity protein n=1 Tax=Corynebacterium sphenisci TaxID=191493 RepID=UPI0026E00837|nr:YhjD/YihY/BrkB family envelope integrity protein [Corynebacterium sphenisci]MDO5731092.1 YhjD/YihY/BrkB family envelope integrity protein [Corynebacterium sphenisci]
MATSTRPDTANTDRYGIERVAEDDPGFVDKLRAKWGWFDHLMRMQERYAGEGGNHFSAGVTYFSVLSIFPILMMVFGVLGFVLAGNQELLGTISDQLTESAGDDLGATLNGILDTAIEQRKSVLSIGFLTALWSGLTWMSNLRMAITALWKRPMKADNFVIGKLRDLVRLLGLLVMIFVTFAITAVGSSGLTGVILDTIGLGGVPGIGVVSFLVALALGLLANWVLFFWMLTALPRGEVPLGSTAKGAIIGAVGLELVKQLGSVFFSNALANPAGAAFGPIIGVMVVLYLVWRITMYASAWAATSEAALAMQPVDAPPPAIINIRGDAGARRGLLRR